MEEREKVISFDNDTKRKILKIVENQKRKNLPQKMIINNIKDLLTRRKINYSEDQLLLIYNDCEAYLNIRNLFSVFCNKNFEELNENETQQTIQFTQIYLSKKKYSDISIAEAKSYIKDKNLGEELAKKYLYNPDGRKKIRGSLVEDKLLTIYLRTGKYDELEKNVEEHTQYDEENKKIIAIDERTASKHIKMLVLEGRQNEALTYIKENLKLFESDPVIMYQLYNIYNARNDIEGCLQIIYNAEKLKISDYEPSDKHFLKLLSERANEELEKSRNMKTRMRLRQSIKIIYNLINNKEQSR